MLFVKNLLLVNVHTDLVAASGYRDAQGRRWEEQEPQGDDPNPFHVTDPGLGEVED